jgi:hypothetical protein
VANSTHTDLQGEKPAVWPIARPFKSIHDMSGREQLGEFSGSVWQQVVRQHHSTQQHRPDKINCNQSTVVRELAETTPISTLIPAQATTRAAKTIKKLSQLTCMGALNRKGL